MTPEQFNLFVEQQRYIVQSINLLAGLVVGVLIGILFFVIFREVD